MTGFYEGTDGIQQPVPHDLVTHEDVVFTTLANKDVVVYNDSTEQWENLPQLIPTDSLLNQIGDVDAPNPTVNHILSWNGVDKWVSAALSDGSILVQNDLDDTVITGPQEGEQIRYTGGFWQNIPGTGYELTLGDGTTEASLILSASDTTTATIDFQTGEPTPTPTWSIINPGPLDQKHKLFITNGDSSLLFDDLGMTWNKDFIITTGNDFKLDGGEVTATSMQSTSYLLLNPSLPLDTGTGIYWGATNAASTSMRIDSAANLSTSHTDGILIQANNDDTATRSFISLDEDFGVSVRNAGNTGYVTLAMSNNGLVTASAGFATSFDYTVAVGAGGGHFVSPNVATQDEHCPNWKQVKDWVALNFIPI
jgi:hypothetical protein